jgi:hypothetical protein
MASPPIGAVITCRDELVELLRARKGELRPSNAFIEEQLHMAAGGADKVLGPSGTKGMSLYVMFDMVELLGGRLVFQVDPQTEARMRERWERRSEKPGARAGADQQGDHGKGQALAVRRAGQGRPHQPGQVLTAKRRREIARTAALSRWRLHRAAAKSRAQTEASA